MSERRQTELMETNQGNFGSIEMNGAGAVVPATGKIFTKLIVMTETVVAAQTDVSITNADLSVFTSIPAGAVIYGRWSSITLTSGQVIAYYENL